jgi:predicted transcriptional regulator
LTAYEKEDSMSAKTRELTLNISEELVKRLEAEAKYQNLALSQVVEEALEQYLDIEDTPDEEILEGLRQAVRDVREGRTYPARQALEEIRRELELSDDQD